MSKQFSGVRIDEGMLKSIDTLAQGERRSRSDMIRILIDEALCLRSPQEQINDSVQRRAV